MVEEIMDKTKQAWKICLDIGNQGLRHLNVNGLTEKLKKFTRKPVKYFWKPAEGDHKLEYPQTLPYTVPTET